MTKIVVERETLSSALAFVVRYAEKKGYIPALTHVRLDAAGSVVTATATNLEQSARITFPADTTEAGSFCVPVALLRKMVDLSSGAEVSITTNDRDAIILCGKQKFSLAILPASDLPQLPMLESDEGKTFSLDAALIKRAAREVSFAVEDPRGAYFLTGVSWRSAEGALTFAATDKRRLSTLTAPCAEDFDIIVPNFDIPDWAGEVRVRVSSLFIRLECGAQVVASKLIEGTYPDVRRVFPSDTRPLLFDRAEFLSSIKRTILACDIDYPSVLIVGREGLATVSAKSAEREASDELRYEGEDFQIAFTSSLILSVLQSFDCEMIQFGYVSHTDTAILTDPKDDTRSALAFPYHDSRLAEFISHREAA